MVSARSPLTVARRFVALAVVCLALATVSCGSGGSVSECRAAARVQAVAEDAYIVALTAASDDHDHAPSDDHDHAEIDELVIASRVDVIVAAEATRRACQ